MHNTQANLFEHAEQEAKEAQERKVGKYLQLMNMHVISEETTVKCVMGDAWTQEAANAQQEQAAHIQRSILEDPDNPFANMTATGTPRSNTSLLSDYIMTPTYDVAPSTAAPRELQSYDDMVDAQLLGMPIAPMPTPYVPPNPTPLPPVESLPLSALMSPEAQESVNAYTRRRMREDEFLRQYRHVPPISNTYLSRDDAAAAGSYTQQYLNFISETQGEFYSSAIGEPHIPDAPPRPNRNEEVFFPPERIRPFYVDTPTIQHDTPDWAVDDGN